MMRRFFFLVLVLVSVSAFAQAPAPGQTAWIQVTGQGAEARAVAPAGADCPDALVNGRLGGFSSERLMRCLTALGQDVEIVVKTTARGTGRGRIRVVEKAA